MPCGADGNWRRARGCLASGGLRDGWSRERRNVTGKDLVLLAGGAFLIYKTTEEIHDRLEGAESEHGTSQAAAVTFGSVIAQVLLLDLVFSVDSVITAVGMTEHVWVMVAAVLTAVGVMLFASKAIYTFVNGQGVSSLLCKSLVVG